MLPLKAETVRREAMAQLEDLPGWVNTVIGDLLSEVHRLDERIAEYDRHVALMARQSSQAQQQFFTINVFSTSSIPSPLDPG